MGLEDGISPATEGVRVEYAERPSIGSPSWCVTNAAGDMSLLERFDGDAGISPAMRSSLLGINCIRGYADLKRMGEHAMVDIGVLLGHTYIIQLWLAPVNRRIVVGG